MNIRDYLPGDESSWVRCRLLSFLDTSYFDDIRKTKEIYDHPSVCLVAEAESQIIGLIDVEYEKDIGDVCYLRGGLGATIWHLGVMPEYRCQGIATQLWNATKTRLTKMGIMRFEVWTQDDIPSNRWYMRQGFILKEAYLSAFIRGVPEDDIIQKYVRTDQLGDVYGIRSFNFEAPIERKAELEQICYRLHEVRLYEHICQ